MDRRSRAQSEVVGIVLLVGVVVVLVIGVGAVVLSGAFSDEQTRATIESDVTANNVTLDVRGGDAVAAEDVLVLLRGDDEQRLRLQSDLTLVSGSGADRFEPGDRWRGTNPISSGELTLLVVDTDAGSVLHEETYLIGAAGLVLEVGGQSGVATIGQGETVNYTVTRTYRRADAENVTDEATVGSDDDSVVSVDAGAATVTGESSGTTTVTAETSDFTDAVTVTVESGTSTFAVEILETNSPVVEGEALQVNGTVENTGSGTDTQSITLSDFDGTTVDSESIQLAGGEDATFNLTWNTTVGDADTGTVTVESDDDGSSATVSVEERPYFDVAITETNAPVLAGEQLQVNGTVENTGDRSDEQLIELRDFDGTPVDTETIQLDGGEDATFNLTWQTSDGDAGSDEVTVASENETETTAVTVEEPGFFTVNITETNSPVVEGDDLEVTANVTNTGEVTVTQTVTLNDTEFDDQLQDSTDVTLSGGESNESVVLTWETETGDGGTGNVTVASENQTDTAEVTVREPAFFAVEIVDTNSPVEEGETLEITVEVENTGDLSDTQTLLLESDAPIGVRQRTVSLNGGESTTELFEIETSAGDAGTYTVTASSDDDSDSEDVTVQSGGIIPGFRMGLVALAILLATLLSRRWDRDQGRGEQQ